MKPLGHRVLVRPIKETKTKSGIIIPESGANTNRGKVIFIGTAVEKISVGDTVIYHENSGIELKYEDVDHLMLGCGKHNSQIVAILPQ